MESHVMVDLETMGNKADAPIIAIGAVSFDENGVSSEFYTQVQLQSSVDAGANIDCDTVIWWMKQSEEARSKFFDNESAQNIRQALIDFSHWFKSVNGVFFWGCGAAFDNVILAGAYDRCGIQRPWAFWNDRCYRTVRDLHPGIEFVRVGDHHNALDDAKSQALHLIKIMNNGE